MTVNKYLVYRYDEIKTLVSEDFAKVQKLINDLEPKVLTYKTNEDITIQEKIDQISNVILVHSYDYEDDHPVYIMERMIERLIILRFEIQALIYMLECFDDE